jgi:cytochrome c5
MTRNLVSTLALTALFAAVACNTTLSDTIFSPNPDGYGGSGSGTGGSGSGASGTGSSTGTSMTTGDIPCEVADVLAAHCDACHANNIPPILRGRADFLAPATDASKTLGQVSVERMQATTDPMPPDGAPAADAAIMAAWVSDGMPAGDCGSGGGGGAGPNPYDTPEQCSSGNTWNNGDNGGDRMYPGRACNNCHKNEKPDEIFSIAGTVYPTAHEPDNCLGVGTGEATIEVTDNNGAVTTVSTNSSGNFRSKANYAWPITVRVLAGGKSLAMVTKLDPPGGDCNTCHNLGGTDGAPGRIILPF